MVIKSYHNILAVKILGWFLLKWAGFGELLGWKSSTRSGNTVQMTDSFRNEASLYNGPLNHWRIHSTSSSRWLIHLGTKRVFINGPLNHWRIHSTSSSRWLIHLGTTRVFINGPLNHWRIHSTSSSRWLIHLGTTRVFINGPLNHWRIHSTSSSRWLIHLGTSLYKWTVESLNDSLNQFIQMTDSFRNESL